MNEFLSFFSLLLSDSFIFIVLQTLILFIVIYAGTIGRKHTHSYKLPDGFKPAHLVLAYSVLSASLIQAVSATDMLIGFKLLITLSNLWAVFYLCFFNAWFRSILARVVVKAEQGMKLT